MPAITAYLDKETFQKYRELTYEEKFGLVRKLLKKYFAEKEKDQAKRVRA